MLIPFPSGFCKANCKRKQHSLNQRVFNFLLSLSLTLLGIKCSPCPRPKWKYDLMFVYWVTFAFPRTVGCKFWFTDLTSSPKHRESPQGACCKHIHVQLNLLGRHCVKIEWCFRMLKWHHSVVSLHSRCKSKDSAKQSCQILIKLIGYQCYS